MTYSVKIFSQFEYRPRGWRGCKVGVFENDKQIGEYERNYGSFFNTFFPFQSEGGDFALYSPDYTITRIMELPSCKDIGGEDPHDRGFCPVDYFVPTYLEEECVHISNNAAFPPRRVTRNRINNPDPDLLNPRSSKHNYVNGNTGQECEDILEYRPLTQIEYYPFGFVSGCVWADDSSWKIQYLDLSQAARGIVKREERFGYVELPDNLSLKDAINMADYGHVRDEEWTHYIQINTVQTFDMRSGKVIDPLE